jgi:hypothetical protein
MIPDRHHRDQSQRTQKQADEDAEHIARTRGSYEGNQENGQTGANLEKSPGPKSTQNRSRFGPLKRVGDIDNSFQRIVMVPWDVARHLPIVSLLSLNRRPVGARAGQDMAQLAMMFGWPPLRRCGVGKTSRTARAQLGGC